MLRIYSRLRRALSFEFLGFGWCTVRTPRGAWEIVEQVDRANVGMTVDCAHLFAGGGLLDEIDALDPAKVFAFHLDDVEDTCKEAITDNTRVYPGLGVIPLNELCARMSRIGDHHFQSLERRSQRLAQRVAHRADLVVVAGAQPLHAQAP